MYNLAAKLAHAMRYTGGHKERTRARVVAEAAAAIQSKGAERVGVAEVMAHAGLTHGGFYAHFKSKDDLVAHAVTHMFDASYGRFLMRTEGRTPVDALANQIDGYLAMAHRLNRANGCPIAALAGDLPNLPELAQARFTDGLERLVAAYARLLRKLGAKNAEALAWSAIAEMSGALALSRTVSDPKIATKILQNSRSMVKSRMGLNPARTRGD
jgi:TetR/AcrR family transcriptional regulator, transcriptional repressor for nem operon